MTATATSAPTEPDNKPEGKKYGLKSTESGLLRFIQMQQQGVFSSVLTHIASDRLAYPVTEHTQFELNGDLSELIITERPAPVEQPPAPIEAPAQDTPAPDTDGGAIKTA